LSIEIRTVPPAELRAWIAAVETAFGEEAHDDRWSDLQRIIDPERVLGAYDGDRIVGGGADFGFKLTVPGGRQLPAAGVTAVGVLPTHRRRGILNQLMRRQLDDVRRRGDQLAILWASEASIYQRYGYGLGSLNASIEIDRERSAFRDSRPPSGAIRLVGRDEAADLMPPVYDAVRATTPGFYERSATWWDVEILSDYEWARRGAGRKYFAVHERDGRPTGHAIYRIRSEWGDVGSKSELRVIEALAVDPAATRDVWRYLFDIDLIARITAHPAPVDHPLLLLLAEPRRLRLRVGDGLWLRILDVPAALAGRGYGADGQLVLEVTDALLPELGGRWRLDVAGGSGEVSASGDPADVALDTTDLAAVYLGAFSFADLVAAGRGRARDAASVARADLLFATERQPWCPEIF
jgi:predicted acetyltransferase